MADEREAQKSQELMNRLRQPTPHEQEVTWRQAAHDEQAARIRGFFMVVERRVEPRRKVAVRPDEYRRLWGKNWDKQALALGLNPEEIDDRYHLFLHEDDDIDGCWNSALNEVCYVPLAWRVWARLKAKVRR